MRTTKFIVKLTPDESRHAQHLIQRHPSNSRKAMRARILLKAHAGLNNCEIAKVLKVGLTTVVRIRKRYAEEGYDPALSERSRPGHPRKLTPRQESQLLALASSTPPVGHQQWTLRQLARKTVELGWVSSLSHETVRHVLNKQAGHRNPLTRTT